MLRTVGLRRHRAADGAAAVEFALVATVFFTLLFGTIQYGLYFFDALGTRQGVREAVRQGVVKNFPACGSAATDMEKLSCNTKAQVDAITGPIYVKVVTPMGWSKGKPLVVCAMVESDGGIGMLPMPDGGIITTKTTMSIEKEGTPSGTPSSDAPPAGADWTWCT